jgi:hypothetical protein
MKFLSRPAAPGASAAGGELPSRRREHDTRAPIITRRRALLITGGVAGLLGLGWLADGLAGIPLGGSSQQDHVQQAGLYHVRLALDPAHPVAGARTALTTAVTDATGAPATDVQARFALSMPAMAMDPVILTTTALDRAQYRAWVAFPMSGDWVLDVTLITPRQRALAAHFDIGVR